ncbi:MAG: Gfo/Idh/MocA family oxidoreductase [Planctomycetes bacterium]|nr:Gfo/Idh/MocA family oxidoreductase [Planctomycetota bacterium]
MSQSEFKTGTLSRRSLIKQTAAVGLFTFVPKSVLGDPNQPSANDKLNIACVGIGGKGHSDTLSVSSQNIAALCDVDDRYAARTFEMFPQAKRYRDFRHMLDKQNDIDAVVIATPDHTHALIALTAMKMGKHVYCQKPLTHTVEETRLMRKVAAEMKVATQMGNQGQASEQTRLIQEFISDGAIGPVRQVHIWTDRPMQGVFGEYWPQGVDRPTDAPSAPEHLDWDLWLGPAPRRPYHPAYHPFKWRGWWDFGTGALGDIGCHAMDPVFRALKLGYPLSVQASCTRVNTESYPVASMVTYEFPSRGKMPPVTITWYDGGLKPPRPEELEPGQMMGTGGTLYIGDKGKILNGRIIPETKMKEYTPPAKTLPRSIGHYEEWIEACKGGKPAGSNFEFAGHLTEVVLMGNIALRVELREKLMQQKLLWDAEKREFSNLPEANAFLKKDYRPEFSIHTI